MSKRSAKAASDAITGWGTLVLGSAISLILLYKNILLPTREPSLRMGFDEYFLFNIALLLWPPLLFLLLGVRRDLSEFALQSGDLRRGTIAALVGFACFIPVILIVAPTKQFQTYYLGALLSESRAVTGMVYRNGILVGGHVDLGRLFYHETVLGIYMLAWEWFFRGFLFYGLKKIFPTWGAAVIQAGLFCLLHWGKPPVEWASSFPGGLVLAAASFRFKSVWPCFLIHYLISLSHDLAVLFFHFR